MAELSAKEYWLLKEIEEKFLEYVDPSDLLYYMWYNELDPGPWTFDLRWVDSKDLIEFDNVVHKQSY